MRRARLFGHALVEWALCVPVLVALISLLFGFVFLIFQQLCLERLCAQTLESLCRSDAGDLGVLTAEANQYIAAHSTFDIGLRLDRHTLPENSSAGFIERPAIEVVGVELTWAPALLRGNALRAYVRGARIR